MRLRLAAFAATLFAAWVALSMSAAHAALFDDEEARKQIFQLRNQVEARQKSIEERLSSIDAKLGQKRAEGVKRMLVLMGATDSQVEPVSLGEEKPRCSEHAEGCWSQNRRSDMLYSGEY